MRRFTLLITVPVLFAASVLLAGCGGGTALPTVSGAFGQAPKVTIPQEKPDGKLEIKTIIAGKGPQVHSGDLLVADYVGHIWNGTTSRLAASSFQTGMPAAFPVGHLVKGLNEGLIGQRVGSRVLMVVPPKDGYGTKGQPEVGVSGTDTLVFVVDILGAYPPGDSAQGQPVPLHDPALPTVRPGAPGKGPTVQIPHTAPPRDLVAKTLIRGTGPQVRKGQLLVVHYLGETWRTGTVFDSSWQRAQPAAFAIGVGQVVKGWDQGLVGQTVGSRVLLVVPPKDGYGTKGQPQAGIKGDDTLVFVVDILGAK